MKKNVSFMMNSDSPVCRKAFQKKLQDRLHTEALVVLEVSAAAAEWAAAALAAASVAAASAEAEPVRDGSADTRRMILGKEKQ